MKAMICMCLVAMVAGTALARPGEQYTDKYDNVNVDEIMHNNVLRQEYFKCIMDKQTKCTPEAKELKSHIVEALDDGCARCSEGQKTGAKKVIQYMINCQPEEWKELAAKYDPENKYSQKYEKELKEVTGSGCDTP